MITITMDDDMARAVLDAVELSMRLRINQPEEICWKMLNLADDDFCEKRDAAGALLKDAFNIIFPPEAYFRTDDRKWKNDEWYRLYNVYQVMNDHFGKSNFKPMQLTDVPLPRIEVVQERRK